MSELNWKKLKDFKCPKCSNELNNSLISLGYFCGGCGFKITRQKFDEVIKDMYKPRVRIISDDNLGLLNNL